MNMKQFIFHAAEVYRRAAPSRPSQKYPDLHMCTAEIVPQERLPTIHKKWFCSAAEKTSSSARRSAATAAAPAASGILNAHTLLKSERAPCAGARGGRPRGRAAPKTARRGQPVGFQKISDFLLQGAHQTASYQFMGQNTCNRNILTHFFFALRDRRYES